MLERLFARPLHIKPESALGLIHSISNASESVRTQPIAARPTETYWGDSIPQMTIENNVAWIPVDGPIYKGASGADQYYGGLTSHENIASDVLNAVDAGVSAIVFNMNSPGGTVAGTHELATLVSAVSKDVSTYVWNENLSASAAEYFTAGVGARFGTPSSINGSIGTIMQVPDFSKFLENLGIQFHIVTSGPLKSTGNPMKAPSEAQMDWMRSFVMDRAAEFKGHMTGARAGIEDAAMQGQVFTGSEAVKNGFLDGVFNSKQQFSKAILGR